MTKILIVEDDAGLRQALEINLRLENYDPIVAADGEEAVDRFHSENPDIVLLDLMIPKKSGFEVLDHIRKHSKIPVILLTARGAEPDKVRGLRGGASSESRSRARGLRPADSSGARPRLAPSRSSGRCSSTKD